MPKYILVDFEKIKDPYSGLGQFCAHLKFFFDKSELNIQYWMPGKFQKLAKKIPFILPRADVFHAIHQDSPYLPWSAKSKYILTIHDLNALNEQTQFGSGEIYKKHLQKKIDRADMITFISKFTQSEVEKKFDLTNKKQQIIYNGIALGNESQAPAQEPQQPFLFSVGTVLPKKNFHVLIDLMKEFPEYNLIIAGTTFHSYAKEMQQKIVACGLSGRIHLIGTIDEKEKLWYYQNAKAFVFPSLLEGFGLPVAEAMSLGLPLFLSDKTSLPEIGGVDAFYFSHFEASHMKEVFQNGMQTFSADQKIRLIEQSKKYSWEKAAKQYLDIYRSI